MNGSIYHASSNNCQQFIEKFLVKNHI